MPTSRLVTPRHWLLLFFACTVMFSNYYCYDIPAALNVPLQKWLEAPYDKYQWQINLLYTVYSLPNIILPLIGGLLVDNLSATTMLVVFATLVSVGQTIFATGIVLRKFNIMVIGRIIFGAGGESLEVATSRITTEWFKGRGLGFAMSLHLSMARIAAASNDNLSPWLAETFSTPVAVWFGLFVCLCSFACAVAMIYLDRPSSRAAAGVFTEPSSSSKKRVAARRDSSADEVAPLLGNNQVHTYESLPAMESDSRPGSRRPSTDLAGVFKSDDGADGFVEEEEEYDEEDENVHFSQLRGLNLSFWMLCTVTIALYGSSVPFFHICTDFFQQKWYPDDSQKAGMVMSIPDIVSAIGSPLCGLFIDRYGHRATLFPIAGLLVMITYGLLGWTYLTPILPMVLLGIAYSIFASALWTCIPYLVGPHQIATAYGLVAVALNVSLALFPLAVANIRSSYPATFQPVLALFIALGTVAVFLSTILCIVDEKAGGVLRNPHHHHHHHHHHNSTSPVDKNPSESSLPDVDGDITPRSVTRSPHRHPSRSPQRPTSPSSPSSSDSESDNEVVKVLGAGVIVPAPHTHIHHTHARRHDKNAAPCTCASVSDPTHMHHAKRPHGKQRTYSNPIGGAALPSPERTSPTSGHSSAREELHRRGPRPLTDDDVEESSNGNASSSNSPRRPTPPAQQPLAHSGPAARPRSPKK
ncbi:major facilitator superfamily domain-containing protein [Powellomyces hirtus]|nr:major facilitator superfamily domain-containing protein [Powellomyces hirtus]